MKAVIKTCSFIGPKLAVVGSGILLVDVMWFHITVHGIL